MKNKYIIITITCLLYLSRPPLYGSIDTSRYRFHTIPVTPYYHGIHSIVKDSIGRIWYCGRDKLYMYDGYSFKQIDDRSAAIPSDLYWVYNQLFTDKSHNLLVATNHGLYQFNYQSFSFKRLINGFVNSITQDDDGTIWLIRNNNIESFSLQEGKVLQNWKMPEDNAQIPSLFQYLSENNGYVYFAWKGKIYYINREMSSPQIFSVIDKPNIMQVVEHKNLFYILTERDGVYVTDKNGKIQKVISTSPTKDPVAGKKIYVDPYDVLWVATQNGLFLYDTNTSEHSLLEYDPENSFSIPHNSVWSVYPDPDGGIWISTYGGKLAYMNFFDNQVNYKNPTSIGLNSSIVSCFEEDNYGNIWIGTEGGGLNLWDRKTGKYSYYTSNQKNTITSNFIKALHFDHKRQQLGIAMYGGSINFLNMHTLEFNPQNIKYPQNQTKQMNAYDFVLEADSGIWISDADLVESLYYKNLRNGSISSIPFFSKENAKSKYARIESMHRDDTYLYLFAHIGLFRMDIKTREVTDHYLIEDSSFAVNDLRCYAKSSRSEFWVGTMGGGVNKLDAHGNYINYNKENGFMATTVFSILEDTDTGNIWFSTDNGLILYDQSTKTFLASDIISTKAYGSFYPRACLRTSQGELFFGGTNGFISFKPSNLKFNPHKPTAFFTEFHVNNHLITPSTPDSPLQNDISTMSGNSGREIRLSHNQNNVEVKFSSTNYFQTEENSFACRLWGSSGDWQFLPAGQNFIQYYNLSPGSYTLEVKTANNHGVWGEETATLHFRVNTPPWLSPWAFILYTAIILSITYFVWKYFANKKLYELEIRAEKIKEQQMKELIQLRVNFFTNISHDLKTPLTLIVDPLQRLIETLPEEHTQSAHYAKLIEKNVKRIQRMISQLLQFRQIESKKRTLHLQPGNLTGYISNIFSLFTPYAGKREISTKVTIHEPDIQVIFDYDIIENIFSNLFSNAIKYTPDKESIILEIRESTPKEIKHVSGFGDTPDEPPYYLTFTVTNTGVEFNKEEKDKIFTSFTLLSDKENSFDSSSGLGLSIVKELVEALSGRITLGNVPNEVTFTLTIPFRRMTSIDHVPSFTYKHTLSELQNINEQSEYTEQDKRNYNMQYSVVVLEDDTDLRNYLEKELSVHYTVYTSTNGVDGLSLIKRVMPTLIITDLMMPKMDGFDVCRILKSDIKTSHIPLIILSALGNNTDHKIQGLKEGADVFIEKPVDVSFLMQQAKSLIAKRESLKELYSKKFTVNPSQITVSNLDEELLRKATSFIEKNIHNQDYDVEAFVSDMAISRTLLYQKINHITGMSIKEFILDMRLKRSTQLLKDSAYSVSEIAYMVGFNDASYFSVCFKKKYNISPSKFRSQP